MSSDRGGVVAVFESEETMDSCEARLKWSLSALRVTWAI
jgi:hypothetical protein